MSGTDTKTESLQDLSHRLQLVEDALRFDVKLGKRFYERDKRWFCYRTGLFLIVTIVGTALFGIYAAYVFVDTCITFFQQQKYPLIRYEADIGYDFYTWGGWKSSVGPIAGPLYRWNFDSANWTRIVSEEGPLLTPLHNSPSWTSHFPTETRLYLHHGSHEIEEETTGLFYFSVESEKWFFRSFNRTSSNSIQFLTGGKAYPGQRWGGVAVGFQGGNGLNYAFVAFGSPSGWSGLLPNAFWLIVETGEWSWVDIRLGDKILAPWSGPILDYNGTFVAPGGRFLLDGTFHKNSSTLYVYGEPQPMESELQRTPRNPSLHSWGSLLSI